MDDNTSISLAEKSTRAEGPEYLYSAYGLTVSSCIEFPELLPGTGTPAVTITYGDVRRELKGANKDNVVYKALPGHLVLNVDAVGHILIRHGREMIVDRLADSRDEELRLFLLGSAFGALLHQRGLLVLHGSTVKVGDGCVSFLGRSGVGKSTLATELSRRGYACLGDDVCAVTIGDDGVPYAVSTYPQAKLWSRSLGYFNMDATRLRRIRPSIDKRAVRLDTFARDERLPVRRLYALSRGTNRGEDRPDIGIVAVTGPITMRVLRDYTYRHPFLRGLDLSRRHFQQIAHVASRVPVSRIMAPRREFPVEQLANAVEDHFRADGLATDQTA